MLDETYDTIWDLMADVDTFDVDSAITLFDWETTYNIRFFDVHGAFICCEVSAYLVGEGWVYKEATTDNLEDSLVGALREFNFEFDD